MDEYDRELSRMKNDAKAKEEAKRTMDRRKDRFPQINEDFQRMQVIHNEIVRMVQPGKELEYDRLAELAAEMRKRAGRLQTNLAFAEPADESTETPNLDIKNSIFALHDLLVSFVGSPLFKNLGVVDAKVVGKASEDLQGILILSEKLKQKAELEKRTAKSN